MGAASTHPAPGKSFPRAAHEGATGEPGGLAGDRRWVVTDDAGRMLTQREEPRFTRFQPSLVDGALVLSTPGRADLRAPAEPGEPVEVSVFRTPVLASRVGAEADAWLSAALDRKVHLLYL